MTAENDMPDLLERAYACLDRNAIEEARALFVRVCELDPGNADNWLMCGAIAAETGAVREGIQLMKKAIALDPGNGNAHYLMARALSGLGQESAAYASVCNSTANDPVHVDAWVLRGALAGKLGNLDDAESASRRALTLSPANADAHGNLAGVLHRQGRLDDAVAAYRMALKFGVAGHELRCNFAQALAQLGLNGEAAQILAETIDAAPDSGPVHLHAGRVHTLCGDFEKALELFARAAELMPDDSGPLLGTAEVLVRLGRDIEARRFFERAQSITGQVGWIDFENPRIGN